MTNKFQKNLDDKYLDLLDSILKTGFTKDDRTGTGTTSLFAQTIRHDMRNGFPLLTTKKVWFTGVKHELLWFLNGDTNIKYLVDNNVNIWNEWAYERYLKVAKNIEEPDYEYHIDDPNQNCTRVFTQEEFVEKIKRLKPTDKFVKQFGDLGPIYGKQWVNWTDHKTDSEIDLSINQIQNLINRLKTNPDCRRLMVNAWNVGELEDMSLMPCHYGFQVWTREMTDAERTNLFKTDKHITLDEISFPKRFISLMWQQRSVDTFLGLPFNIASYGLLLSMIAKQVNMVPLELIGNLGDTHIYSNHTDQAIKQLHNNTKKYDLPKLHLDESVKSIFDYKSENISLLNYNSYGTIKAPISI